jgi:stage II sporulation protein D
MRLVLAVALALVLVPGADAATWTVKGAGFGHGVGMSAWGAYGYGKHGATAREILDHYYTGIEVTGLDAARRVRVLLKTARGSVSFSGATRACGQRL